MLCFSSVAALATELRQVVYVSELAVTAVARKLARAATELQQSIQQLQHVYVSELAVTAVAQEATSV